VICVYRRRMDEFWCAAAVNNDSDKVYATSFGSNEQGVLKSVLMSLPYNVAFQVVEKQSEFSGRLLTAIKSMIAGEGVSAESFKFEMMHLPKYSRRVLSFLLKVPVGYVTTYGALAEAAGGGARAVGQVMRSNPFAPLIPCHRVVRSDFSLGGYGGEVVGEGVKMKYAILQREDRGYKEPTKIKVDDSVLSVFPVGFVRKD
jgi:methylated-DNA-[protein]-cysteine S-methyltransferase